MSMETFEYAVIRVMPAIKVDSRPVPRPPTQKNGIGMYRRSPCCMHRVSRPAAVAPSAPPWVWMTALGVPLLPEVKMMTNRSAAVTVSAMASTIPRARRPTVAVASVSAVQT